MNEHVILSGPRQTFAMPLRSGPDVSWIPTARVGDNQGEDGACVPFALANLHEHLHGVNVFSADILALYRAWLTETNQKPGAGMTVPTGYELVRRAGWLPGTSGVERVSDLSSLTEQPIITSREITQAFYHANTTSGQVDPNSLNEAVLGYHAMLCVAHGVLDGFKGRWVYDQGSWNETWAHKGICVMSEELHLARCLELWKVV